MYRTLLSSAAVFVFCAVFSCFIVPATAQSFNCARARAADEVAICRDDDLARLDDQMAATYFSTRNRLPAAARAVLEADQADWLASRRVCGGDVRCIRAAYLVRIQEIRQY